MIYGRRKGRRRRINLPRCRINFKKHRINIFKNRNCKKIQCRANNLMSIIGSIIIFIGIVLVFKNITLYSGAGAMVGVGTTLGRGITIGTPCGLEFIILIIGIVFILYNFNSFIGWSLITIGIIWLLIAIIINFKMVFMPMNLLKAIMLFSFVALGISLKIRGLFGSRR